MAPVLLLNFSRNLARASHPLRAADVSFAICFALPEMFRTRIASNKSFAYLAFFFSSYVPWYMTFFEGSGVIASLLSKICIMDAAASLPISFLPIIAL